MLELNIQADRIQADDETLEIWLAVKVSASLSLAGDLGDAELDSVLPWKWQSPTGTDWDPHRQDAWRLWSIDANQVLQPITAHHAVSASVNDPGLIDSLDQAVRAIAMGQGSQVRPDSLAIPSSAKETDLAGSVPGFVERLACVPHPVPCASRVHAMLAIAVTDAGEYDGCRFIATPRIVTASGLSFDPADPPRLAGDDWVVSDGLLAKATIKPSRPVAMMQAKASSGRVLDLYQQLIAPPESSQALPCAEALATLPLALAQCLNPIDRLRSVLARSVSDWLAAQTDVGGTGEGGRAEALFADLQEAKSSRLKCVVDFVAAQVLAARYDAVGRFEVPLIQALVARNDRDAARLLAEHKAALPGRPDRGHIVAALRVDPATLFEDSAESDVAAAVARVSPFSLAFLREASAIGKAWETKVIDDAKSETEILRELWRIAGKAAATNLEQGTRYLELPNSRLNTSDSKLWLSVELREPPALTGDSPANAAQDFASLSFEQHRDSAVLAYAAPFIEGLVSGRTDWFDHQSTTGSNKTLAEHFAESMQRLLEGDDKQEGLYITLLHASCNAAGITIPQDPLKPTSDDQDSLFWLIAGIFRHAAAEAVRMARRLGMRRDPYDTITPTPRPLALQIDQFRTFSRHVDDWTRLSGYGLLVARSAEGESAQAQDPNRTAFWSINRARMYFGLDHSQGARKGDSLYLPEAATMVQGHKPVLSLDANGKSRAFVDPSPFAPGDQVGVSDAIAEFTNAWQTAPMPGAAMVDAHPGAQGGVQEARFLFTAPDKGDGRIPTLSFGWGYGVVAHLVAQGGVLAKELRSKDNPYVLGDLQTLAIDNRVKINWLGNYARTVGIGAPSMVCATQALPADITLLDDELPMRTPRQQLGPDGIRFNFDHDTGASVIDWPPTGGTENVGLRFEFAVDPGGEALVLSVEDETTALPVTLEVSANSGAIGRWYRLDARVKGSVTLRELDVGTLAEQEYLTQVESNWTGRAERPSPLSEFQGEGLYLTLKSLGALVELIRVVQLDAGGNELPGTHGLRPTGVKRQKALLLDGLDSGLSNRAVPRQAQIVLGGPSVDRDTWERWVNSALFSTSALKEVRQGVASQLDALQRQGAASRPQLPDPSVSALWVELWSIFPRRERVGAPCCISSTGLLGAAKGQVEVVVGTAEAFVEITPGKSLKATCQKGKVYELRARAGMLADAAPFDGIRKNVERLALAVRETCSRQTLSGKDWLLGPVSVQPIEVATNEMPTLNHDVWREAAQPRTTASAPWIVRETVVAGQRGVELGFPKALFTDARRLLRYCASATLLPQRWTWRGRPHPFTDDAQTRFRLAFADRRPNDIGPQTTSSLHLIHALGVEGTTSVKNQQPVVLTRTLDWRGGWNLWRFGVRLNSRYAGLFHAAARNQANPDLREQAKQWLNFEVLDRPDSRAIAKPPIALVLPLTETPDYNGRVPPLLVLLSGAVHENDHFGDGIAVAVETARHPWPQFMHRSVSAQDEVAQLKFLPEFGPDPIRTGDPHPGTAIALRVEGPIGYGFDSAFETGRFDHSAFLIVPADQTPVPWSMIKLKLRRFEDPDGLQLPPGAGEYEDKLVQVAEGWPVTASDSHADLIVKWGVPHEGVELRPSFETTGGELELNLEHEQPSTAKTAGQRIVLKLKLAGTAQWTLTAWVVRATDASLEGSAWTSHGLPNAGTLSLASDGLPELRCIVSAGPRPERGDKWQPAGEVVVQFRPRSSSVNDGRDTWLTAFCLPIEAGGTIAITEQPRLNVSGRGGARPVRMSEYASAVWCQFTVASSMLDTPGNAHPIPMRAREFKLCRDPGKKGLPAWTDLYVSLKGSAQQLVLNHGIDATSNIEEQQVVVLTENVSDVFGRNHERPVLVATLAEGVVDGSRPAAVLQSILWPEVQRAPRLGEQGRWRLLRVLVRRGKPLENLEDLFSESLEPSISAAPADGRGMIISISEPADWTFSSTP